LSTNVSGYGRSSRPPATPPIALWQKTASLDRTAYKKRVVIERCFGRLKEFQCIATRYDKLAETYVFALCLVATVAYRL
jgi:transposase